MAEVAAAEVAVAEVAAAEVAAAEVAAGVAAAAGAVVVGEAARQAPPWAEAGVVVGEGAPLVVDDKLCQEVVISILIHDALVAWQRNLLCRVGLMDHTSENKSSPT